MTAHAVNDPWTPAADNDWPAALYEPRRTCPLCHEPLICVGYEDVFAGFRTWRYELPCGCYRGLASNDVLPAAKKPRAKRVVMVHREGPAFAPPLAIAAHSVTTLDTVHCMDALALLRALPEGSVDMIFIDPPYGHNNNDNGDLIQRWEAALGRTRGAGSNPRPIANDGKEANDLFRACLPEIKRVLKSGCCCCCCCCGGGPDPQFARWSLWLDEVLEFKQMVVWDKGPMGMGWHYRRSYETVLVAQKPGAACAWYDATNCIENIIRPNVGIRKIIPGPADHPTPKPVELASWFIGLHTKPGDVVLDCFAGGGSTLVAARNLGRRYIGADIDPRWAQASRERLAMPYTSPLFSLAPTPAVQPPLFAATLP